MSGLEQLPWDIWRDGVCPFLDFRQIVKLGSISKLLNHLVAECILAPPIASASHLPTLTFELDNVGLTDSCDSSSTETPVGSSPTTTTMSAAGSGRRRVLRYAFKIVREKGFYQLPPRLKGLGVPVQHVNFSSHWRKISSPAVWDRIFESLVNVESISVEPDFFACPCHVCVEHRELRDASSNSTTTTTTTTTPSSPAPNNDDDNHPVTRDDVDNDDNDDDDSVTKSTTSSSLEIARRHSFDRFAMTLQVAIRNRQTLKSLVVGYLPSSLSFGLSEDSLVPELPIDFHDPNGKRFRFNKLETAVFSRTIDCRHVVPLLDFCEFSRLKTVAIGALKASYAYLKPQFGLQPTIVFAPQQIVQNCHSLEATPHLPAVYNGAVDENLQFHGQGLYCCNLYSYEGEFEFGFNNGFGRMRANTGETYQGQWRQGRRCGQGVVVQADGTRMSGHWLNDLLEGHASLERRDGLTYEGGWFQSLWDGWGMVSIQGKLVGAAQFQHGLLHGWAKLLRRPEGPIPIWEERWYRRGRVVVDGSDDRNHLLVTTHSQSGCPIAWIEDHEGNILQKFRVLPDSKSSNDASDSSDESLIKPVDEELVECTSLSSRCEPTIMLPNRLSPVSPKSFGSPSRRGVTSPTNLSPPSPISSSSIPQPPNEPRLTRQNAVEWHREESPSNEEEEGEVTSSSSSSAFSGGAARAFSTTSALSFFSRVYTSDNSTTIDQPPQQQQQQQTSRMANLLIHHEGIPIVSSVGQMTRARRPLPADVPEWMRKRLETQFGFEGTLAFPPFPNHLVSKK